MSAKAAAQSVNPAQPSPMLVALRVRPEPLGLRSIPTSLYYNLHPTQASRGLAQVKTEHMAGR